MPKGLMTSRTQRVVIFLGEGDASQRGIEANFDLIFSIATSQATLISVARVLTFTHIDVRTIAFVAMSTNSAGQTDRILRAAKANAIAASLQSLNGMAARLEFFSLRFRR